MRALWLCLIASCGPPVGAGAGATVAIPDDERPRHRHGHCHEDGVSPPCHDHFHGPEHHTQHHTQRPDEALVPTPRPR